MNVKFLGLILALAFTTAVRAVDARFLAWDSSVSKMKIYVMRGASPVEITGLHDLKRTRTFNGLADSAPVSLHLDGMNNPDGTPALCQVNIAGAQHPLILILAAPKLPAGIAAVAVDDDETHFKWGSFLVFNACAEDMVVVATVEKKNTNFKVPHGWTPVPFVPSISKGGFGIELRRASDLTKPVFTNVWEVDPGQRDLVFIVPGTDARTGLYTLKVVPESRAENDADRRAQTAREGGGAGNAPAEHH